MMTTLSIDATHTKVDAMMVSQLSTNHMKELSYPTSRNVFKFLEPVNIAIEMRAR